VILRRLEVLTLADRPVVLAQGPVQLNANPSAQLSSDAPHEPHSALEFQSWLALRDLRPQSDPYPAVHQLISLFQIIHAH
jgi:hypothetical protein